MKPVLSERFLAPLVLVATAAVAATYGPFHISALGEDFVRTTYESDASAEYDGANRVARIYLAPILNTPAKIAKAIKEDSIRVVYFDGQIAEFKIARWPSTIPLDFSQKVSSSNQQTIPAYLRDYLRLTCGGSGGRTVTVQTGYWGTRWEVNGSTVTVIGGSWISTGSFTYTLAPARSPYPRRCP